MIVLDLIEGYAFPETLHDLDLRRYIAVTDLEFKKPKQLSKDLDELRTHRNALQTQMNEKTDSHDTKLRDMQSQHEQLTHNMDKLEKDLIESRRRVNRVYFVYNNIIFAPNTILT